MRHDIVILILSLHHKCIIYLIFLDFLNRIKIKFSFSIYTISNSLSCFWTFPSLEKWFKNQLPPFEGQERPLLQFPHCKRINIKSQNTKAHLPKLNNFMPSGKHQYFIKAYTFAQHITHYSSIHFMPSGNINY